MSQLKSRASDEPGKRSRLELLTFWLPWHALSTLLVSLILSIQALFALQALSAERIVIVATLAMAHMASSVLVATGKPRVTAKFSILFVLTPLGFTCAAMLFLAQFVDAANDILALGAVASVSSLILNLLAIPAANNKTIALTGLLLAILCSGAIVNAKAMFPDLYARIGGYVSATTTTMISTSFHNVELTIRHLHLPRPVEQGGGIARLGPGYIIVSGSGTLFFLEFDDRNSSAHTAELATRVPINISTFREGDGSGTNPNYFRVMDILATENGSEVTLYVSHLYWKTEESCFVSRVSETKTSLDYLLEGTVEITWTTIFETSPCLPIRIGGNRETYFFGSTGGGRMEFLDDGRLLLTVGDFGYNGWKAGPAHAQDRSSSYGKTILINLESHAYEIFSIGHRNPQGLLVDPDGVIWLTEHAQDGGDELNMLVRGRNYGWPLVTYGTSYESKIWPLSTTQGRHDGFEKPMFAWSPGIGISNLIRVQENAFPVWKNDLLVSTLGAKTIFRVRIGDSRVIYVESIYIGKQIRDLVEMEDGKILLLFNNGAIGTLAPVSSDDGPEAIFNTKCASCHSIDIEERTMFGPNLRGIIGRRIGSDRKYSYSRAFSELNAIWAAENLDKFLEDPQSFAPGSLMFVNVQSAEDRAAVIKYLRDVN